MLVTLEEVSSSRQAEQRREEGYRAFLSGPRGEAEPDSMWLHDYWAARLH